MKLLCVRFLWDRRGIIRVQEAKSISSRISERCGGRSESVSFAPWYMSNPTRSPPTMITGCLCIRPVSKTNRSHIYQQFKAAGRDCRCPVGFPACTTGLLLRPLSAIWTLTSIEGSKDRSRKLYAILRIYKSAYINKKYPKRWSNNKWEEEEEVLSS